MLVEVHVDDFHMAGLEERILELQADLKKSLLIKCSRPYRAGDSYDKPGKPNCLVVVLVRAKKLKRLEKYAETPGTTDPTCLLTLDGEKKRSRTVENQLNPHGLSAC